MNPRKLFVLLVLMVSAAFAIAADTKGPGPEKLTQQERRDLIRGLLAEPVYIHRYFPMGQTGIKIIEGRITPTDAEVHMMMAQTGVAAKPGDRAKITDLHFLSKGIVFEINGGPVKKKKWYERLEVTGQGGTTGTNGPVDETKLYTTSQGSYVLLQFKDYIPSLTPDQVKSLLEPVFDFKSGSVSEAYEKALPPKLADAVKNHRALVGMDRDMVTYALGRPPRRYRDRDGDTEYEEWIYGQPPQQVVFVRFIGDKVSRIETMEVDGQKIVRTKDEVGDLNGAISAMAMKDDAKPADDESKRSAPSLMRPGESTVKATPGARPKQDNTNKLPQIPDPSPTPGQDPTTQGPNPSGMPQGIPR